MEPFLRLEIAMSKAPIVLGSKFTGKPVIFLNQGTGEYYEVLPYVDTRIQNAVLKLRDSKCNATKTFSKQHLKTYLTNIKCFLGFGKSLPT